jgi:hypothetical protein
MISGLAKEYINNPQAFFFASQKRNKSEMRQLKKDIELFSETPFLQKMIVTHNEGTREIKEEIDLMKERQERLKQLALEMQIGVRSENELLRKSYSNTFFDRLSYWPNVPKHGNVDLFNFAAELLKDRKKALSPMEQLVEKLSLP